MDRSRDETRHSAAVDRWIDRSLPHRSSADVIGLFAAAFEAVWLRALTTLGEVTLTAIAGRVLFSATAEHPFLSTVNPHPNGDARWRQQLCERLAQVPKSELINGLRFGMIELLTVIGRLTAEILSHDLHTTLDTVTSGVSYGEPASAPLAGASLVTSKAQS